MPKLLLAKVVWSVRSITLHDTRSNWTWGCKVVKHALKYIHELFWDVFVYNHSCLMCSKVKYDITKLLGKINRRSKWCCFKLLVSRSGDQQQTHGIFFFNRATTLFQQYHLIYLLSYNKQLYFPPKIGLISRSSVLMEDPPHIYSGNVSVRRW